LSDTVVTASSVNAFRKQLNTVNLEMMGRKGRGRKEEGEEGREEK